MSENSTFKITTDTAGNRLVLCEKCGGIYYGENGSSLGVSTYCLSECRCEVVSPCPSPEIKVDKDTLGEDWVIVYKNE